jgi:hypothetical protein
MISGRCCLFHSRSSVCTIHAKHDRFEGSSDGKPRRFSRGSTGDRDISLIMTTMPPVRLSRSEPGAAMELRFAQLARATKDLYLGIEGSRTIRMRTLTAVLELAFDDFTFRVKPRTRNMEQADTIRVEVAVQYRTPPGRRLRWISDLQKRVRWTSLIRTSRVWPSWEFP